MILSDFESPMHRSSEEKVGARYDSDFARIEELIKGNTFSWEEITHLMDVLNSRVDNEREKLKTSSAGGDGQLVSWTPEIPKTPFEGKHVIDRTIIGASRENSDVPVGVGASPIDIARAYMANRVSEGGEDLHNFMLNTERAQLDFEFARKPPLFPLASPNPSVCWPGAVVHDRHGFATPQSQRVRHRLHDFSGTPYSRTILSKSTTKLQADSGLANTSSPFQKSQTFIYGQVKSRGEIVDAYGSVGPIRRIRNKFASEVRPRGSIFPSSSKGTPKMVKAQGFGGFLPSTEKNFEPGESSGKSKYMSRDKVSSSSDRGITNTNISSSQAVRKILEHLDRNKPTPKQMEAELKFATGWRRSSPEATAASNVENTSSEHVEELASHNNTDAANPNLHKSSSKSNFLGNFNDEGKDEAKDAVNGNAEASSSIFTRSKSVHGANAKPRFGLEGTSGSVVKFSDKNAFAPCNHQQTDARSLFPRPHLSNGQDGKMITGTTGSNFLTNHGTKPSLPSILINKPALHAVSDNGPGFTFQVSVSSGVNSEPPTPSITPSSSVNILSQPNVVPSTPSYTFCTKKSAPDLVFSFPSTSTSSASTNDASDLKFSFGSDKKFRLSFNSFGNIAICN
ncbi:hypothetical protein ACS0TY_021809 [Phlomoides rotata]